MSPSEHTVAVYNRKAVYYSASQFVAETFCNAYVEVYCPVCFTTVTVFTSFSYQVSVQNHSV